MNPSTITHAVAETRRRDAMREAARPRPPRRRHPSAVPELAAGVAMLVGLAGLAALGAPLVA